MNKLLNEDKEPIEIKTREIDLESGITLDVDLNKFYKDKTSMKSKFKLIHEIKHSSNDSTFVSLDKIQEMIIGDQNIEFDEISSIEASSPIDDDLIPPLDLNELHNIADEFLE